MPGSRILLFVENHRFARMLWRWLEDDYDLIDEWGAQAGSGSPFDLLLIDQDSLKAKASDIRQFRKAALPVFLPSLLLLPHRKSKIPNRLLGKTVDDVLIHPFEKDEVKARVANLLRLRKMSLDLKRKHDQVAKLSVTDDVSGFHNTRYMHRHLDRLLGQANARDRHHSLIFFDIDDFKSVVDAHGHLLGAKTLKEIAEAVHGCLETYDRIVRYGGDEFVVILPRQTKQEAIQKAIQIKEAVAQTRYLKKEGVDLTVTASFGVATFPEDAKDKRSLLAQADQCLFESKDQGKNRIKVFAQDEAGFIV